MGNVENSGWSTSSQQQTVAFGVPITESLVEAVRRLSMRRVVVVTTNSLSGPGGLADRDSCGSRRPNASTTSPVTSSSTSTWTVTRAY